MGLRQASYLFLTEVHNYLNFQEPMWKPLKPLRNQRSTCPAQGDAAPRCAAEKGEKKHGRARGPATATVLCWIKEIARGVTGAAAARGAEGAAEGAALGESCRIKIPVLLLPGCGTSARDLTFLSFDFCI